jgi:uncharacterized coiled-coil protein SlyX
MRKRLKELKNKMNEQQTIILELILRLKSKIVKLKSQLERTNQVKEKLLKIENRVINHDESINDVAIYVNAEIFETFTQLSTIKDRVKQIN